MDQEQRRYAEKQLKLMREMVTTMQERNDILRDMLEILKKVNEEDEKEPELGDKFFVRLKE